MQLKSVMIGKIMVKKINFIVCFILTSIMCVHGAENKKNLRVRIHQSATHVALESTTQGIIDVLTEAGYGEPNLLDIAVESAQGNALLGSQISAKFVSQNPDFIFAVGTISAQSLVRLVPNSQIKLIFASVTDPVGSGIVGNLDCHAAHVSGVSNFLPLGPQINLIKAINPELKKLGVLYNSGESNSIRVIEKLRIECKNRGIILIEQTITKTSELPQASARLATQVEAIYISNDNTCLSGFQSIVQAAMVAKVPVFCSDIDQVKQGALAALGPNQYSLGRQVGQMALRVMKGQSLEMMPVEFPSKEELYINEYVAHQLGIIIPVELLQKAIVRVREP